MSSERNYIRTEAELDLQLKGLVEIRDIMESLGVRMWLSAGTLLGAVRDHDFIPWDWNVSVGCFADELNPKYEQLKSVLSERGFSLTPHDKGEYISLATKRDGIKFVIENVIIIGEWATRPEHKSPASFANSFTSILLRGEYFLCPANPEICVEWQYGADWRIPKRVAHRNEVINPEHRIRKKDNLK